MRIDATCPADRRGVTPRQLVLIDFDWHDVDLLPRLMQTTGVAIRLVAGAGPLDAGVRLAALCGLPHTLELADLTREIFDLALVGERSPRRESLGRLLRALGTPIDSPRAFRPPGGHVEHHEPDATPDAPIRHAATSGPVPSAEEGTRTPDGAGSLEGASALSSSALRGADEEPRATEPSGRALLTPEAFSARLQTAIERHRAEGYPFALYRLTFDGPDEALSGLARDLPDRLRETDCVCSPAPQELLVLCAGAPEAFAHVRRRVERLWRETWAPNADPGALTEIVEERVELALATPSGA